METTVLKKYFGPLFLAVVFFPPSLSIAETQTPLEQLQAAGLGLAAVVAPFENVEYGAGKPGKWKVVEVGHPDFGDGLNYLLVGLEPYTRFEKDGDYSRAAGVFVLYAKFKKGWKRLGGECVGDYFRTAVCEDLTGDGKPEVLFHSGSGNHARFLSVYSVKYGKLKAIASIDSYGCGPAVEEIKGEKYLVDYYVDIEGVCEGCRTCRALVYRWNGTGFTHDPDDLYEAKKKKLECSSGNKVKFEDCEKAHFNVMKILHEKHPDDLVILFNCASYARQFGSKDEFARYSKELREKTRGHKNGKHGSFFLGLGKYSNFGRNLEGLIGE